MVSLVEHDEVPWWGLQQPAHPGPAFQGVNAGDDPVVFRESIGLAIRDVAFAAKDLELQVEDLVELPVPVVDQTRGDNDEGALQLTSAGELAQNQSRLDGLAQTDLIRDQEAPRRGGGHAMSEDNLVRQEIDGCGGKRGGALHQREREGLPNEPCVPQPLVARSHSLEQAFVTGDQ